MTDTDFDEAAWIRRLGTALEDVAANAMPQYSPIPPMPTGIRPIGESDSELVARNRWPPAGPRLSRCRRRAGGSHRRCRATMHGASWQHGAPSLASATVADKAGGSTTPPSSPPKGGDPCPLVRFILTIRTPVQADLAGNVVGRGAPWGHVQSVGGRASVSHPTVGCM